VKVPASSPASKPAVSELSLDDHEWPAERIADHQLAPAHSGKAVPTELS
jgi:hypothetical protein